MYSMVCIKKKKKRSDSVFHTGQFVDTFFKQSSVLIVSFAAYFWMPRNASPKEEGALLDIQKLPAKETTVY